MQPQLPASPAQRRELCRGPEAKLDPVQGWHSPRETLHSSQGICEHHPQSSAMRTGVSGGTGTAGLWLQVLPSCAETQLI